jgi:hypothetical protein
MLPPADNSLSWKGVSGAVSLKKGRRTFFVKLFDGHLDFINSPFRCGVAAVSARGTKED